MAKDYAGSLRSKQFVFLDTELSLFSEMKIYLKVFLVKSKFNYYTVPSPPISIADS